MSKHINTHLFFHMNDSSSSKQKDSGQSSSTGGGGGSKPKKPPSTLISGYEIDTNPPLPSESGDYYDYYTNYGIPEYYGQISPSASSPPYAYYNHDYPEHQQQQQQQQQRQPSSSYYGYDDYYNRPDNDTNNYHQNDQQISYEQQHNNGRVSYGRVYDDYSNHRGGNSQSMAFNYPINNNYNNQHHLQAPLISPPIYDSTKRSSPLSIGGNDLNHHQWSHPPSSSSYRNNNDHHHRGLSTFAHKLHRITFVEACIFQPPDLPSPVRAIGGGGGGQQRSLPPPSLPSSQQQPPLLPPSIPSILQQQQQQGERSPTSTGGTQYYQEWTSKHMRHLCSRFEKPDQQQLLMNVERKSKYPFIILCTPEPTAAISTLLSKSSSSSCSSSTATTTGTATKTSAPATGNHHRYHRELSHNSSTVYSIDDNDDNLIVGGNGGDLLDDIIDDDLLDDNDIDDDDRRLMGAGPEEEEHWITQKQRDSVNSHYLPPPPPPLLMPHIWPEIRYIDGLYTVCASIVRPGSGVPCEFDEYLYSDINNHYSSSFDHHQPGQGKHISFQDTASMKQSATTSNHHHHHHQTSSRPAGYIVSAFATFPGEDSDRLEKNWLFWTGARILYKYLPTCVGLRRLIFLKRCPDMYREDLMTNHHQQSKMKPTIFTGFTYVLLCECFNLKESYIASVCTTIDQLRARCCGYSALYLTHFQQKLQQQQPSLHFQRQYSQQQSHHSQQQQQQQQQYHHYQQQQQQQFHPLHHHQQQQQQPHHSYHHHHHIPRHHRSTSDFNEYDGD
ncbi:uncharacterized protein LOC124490334 [Dermatophagoides farinae]|uniref:uncharacterized protein LOC124490334 n=1 Tax=Dermatophagoides farinae TaxID=6954 RepID=UPI003F621DB8